jgi:hypothetical protein
MAIFTNQKCQLSNIVNMLQMQQIEKKYIMILLICQYADLNRSTHTNLDVWLIPNMNTMQAYVQHMV